MVHDWLARRSYDRELGARPLARLIEQGLEGRIAHVLVAATRPAGRLSVALSTIGDLTVDLRR